MKCTPMRLRNVLDVNLKNKIKDNTNLSDDEITIIYKRFNSISNNGKLNYDKFEKSLGILGSIRNAYLYQSIFRAFDLDNDGYLDFYEFCVAINVMLKGSKKDKLKLSYRIVHAGNTKKQIETLLKESGELQKSQEITKEEEHKVKEEKQNRTRKREDYSNYITYEELEKIVLSIHDIKQNLLGTQENIMTSHIRYIFKSLSYLCEDGVFRMNLECYRRAMKCNEFLNLLGINTKEADKFLHDEMVKKQKIKKRKHQTKMEKTEETKQTNKDTDEDFERAMLLQKEKGASRRILVQTLSHNNTTEALLSEEKTEEKEIIKETQQNLDKNQGNDDKKHTDSSLHKKKNHKNKKIQEHKKSKTDYRKQKEPRNNNKCNPNSHHRNYHDEELNKEKLGNNRKETLFGKNSVCDKDVKVIAMDILQHECDDSEILENNRYTDGPGDLINNRAKKEPEKSKNKNVRIVEESTNIHKKEKYENTKDSTDTYDHSDPGEPRENLYRMASFLKSVILRSDSGEEMEKKKKNQKETYEQEEDVDFMKRLNDTTSKAHTKRKKEKTNHQPNNRNNVGGEVLCEATHCEHDSDTFYHMDSTSKEYGNLQIGSSKNEKKEETTNPDKKSCGDIHRKNYEKIQGISCLDFIDAMQSVEIKEKKSPKEETSPRHIHTLNNPNEILENEKENIENCNNDSNKNISKEPDLINKSSSNDQNKNINNSINVCKEPMEDFVDATDTIESEKGDETSSVTEDCQLCDEEILYHCDSNYCRGKFLYKKYLEYQEFIKNPENEQTLQYPSSPSITKEELLQMNSEVRTNFIENQTAIKSEAFDNETINKKFYISSMKRHYVMLHANLTKETVLRLIRNNLIEIEDYLKRKHRDYNKIFFLFFKIFIYSAEQGSGDNDDDFLSELEQSDYQKLEMEMEREREKEIEREKEMKRKNTNEIELQNNNNNNNLNSNKHNPLHSIKIQSEMLLEEKELRLIVFKNIFLVISIIRYFLHTIAIRNKQSSTSCNSTGDYIIEKQQDKEGGIVENVNSLKLDEVHELLNQANDILMKYSTRRYENKRIYVNKSNYYNCPKKGKLSVSLRQKKTKVKYHKILAVYFGHERWDLVMNMMIGIRISSMKEFDEATIPNYFEHKDILELPNAHDQRKVIFKNYAPVIFRNIRSYYGIKPNEYMTSIGPEQVISNMVLGNLSTLSELLSEGKSGSLFYFTSNGKYIIKTICKSTYNLSKAMLPKYYTYIKSNPDTLLTRLYGIHSIQYDNKLKNHKKKIYFIVMNNFFSSAVEIHRRYDIKGSLVGRTVPHEKREDHTIALKDMDIDEMGDYMDVGTENKEKLQKVLLADTNFLKENYILDYSLLFGIHYKELSKDCVNWEETNANEVNHVYDEAGNCVASKPFHQSDHGGLRNVKKNRIFFFGIIDIFTTWSLRKKMEHTLRTLQKFDRKNISCIHPNAYAQRFVNFIEKHME